MSGTEPEFSARTVSPLTAEPFLHPRESYFSGLVSETLGLHFPTVAHEFLAPRSLAFLAHLSDRHFLPGDPCNIPAMVPPSVYLQPQPGFVAFVQELGPAVHSTMWG